MHDEHELLERASEEAPTAGFTIADLERRRDRRVALKRLEAGVIGLTIAALLVGGGLAVLERREGTVSTAGSETSLPPAPRAPVQAAAGQYYYAKTWSRSQATCDGDVGKCTYRTTEAETWWAPDESGRIATATEDTTYTAGEFPHDTITTSLPTDPTSLREAMFERTGPDGASPEPQTTVSPGQDGMDASVEQSMVNLLAMPNTTPALRAGLLEVLAGMPDVSVDLHSTDPVGRPAYLLEVTTFGGPTVNELYVDPGTHGLLAHIEATIQGDVFGAWILHSAGVTNGTDGAPQTSTVPAPASEASPSDLPPSSSRVDSVDRCSQGGPDLVLTQRDGLYDNHCFVVETGSPFTITFHIADAGRRGRLSIQDGAGERVFVGAPLVGPGSITYQVPPLDQGDYFVVNEERPRTNVGPLYVR
jgi:hypothetical protein